MLEAKPGSWLFMVPAFAMGFYAVNQWSFATGLMDPMIPFLLGTSEEYIPIITGPIGKSLWLSNAFALTALCYLFLPSTGLPPKTTFQGYFLVQLPWLPLLVYMYATGILGVMGIAQFGSFATTVTALSVYTYLKLE